MVSLQAKADHVDIGYDKELRVKAVFHTNYKILVEGESGANEKFGVGYGYKDKDLELGFIMGISQGSEKYYKAQGLYKNGRHSIYDLSIEQSAGKFHVIGGYTHLFSESFGVVAQYNITNKRAFFGFRKWI